MRIKETRGNSLYLNGVPDGCRHCIKGEKAVIFLGGACHQPDHCAWYCPISHERRGPVTFVDELQVGTDDDILAEIHAIDAKGISFTGGEPMRGDQFNAMLRYLRLAKDERPGLHAHLYTTGISVTPTKVEAAAEAGLDEIRFHPPRDHIDSIDLAKGIISRVGAELPAIPDIGCIDHVKAVILHLERIEAHFININEFEFSDTNAVALQARGFRLKEDTIAAVGGSEEAAMTIMDWYASDVRGGLQVHYCPVVTKDEHQLKNRYRRRATTTRRAFETITADGTVLFGRATFNGDAVSFTRFVEDARRVLGSKKGLLDLRQETQDLVFAPAFVRNKRFVALLRQASVTAGIVEALPTNDRDECEFTPLDG